MSDRTSNPAPNPTANQAPKPAPRGSQRSSPPPGALHPDAGRDALDALLGTGAENEPPQPAAKRSRWRNMADTLKNALSRRTRRTERTPFYLTDLPEQTYKALDMLREEFIRVHGRDYEDDDRQFPAERWPEFRRELSFLLRVTKHHPAQIHAFEKTGKLITDRNFRQVPNGWTVAWEEAVDEYAKWAPGLDAPPKIL